MKTLFTAIVMSFGLCSLSLAQNTRQDENKTFLVTDEGVHEISSFELIFSESSCDSNMGLLKVYFNEIRSNLVDRGFNVKMRITESGNGIIAFDTASNITLELINSWLTSQGISAIELTKTISKN